MLNFPNDLAFCPFPEFITNHLTFSSFPLIITNNFRFSPFPVFKIFNLDLTYLRSGPSRVNPTKAKDCELQLELSNTGETLNPRPKIYNIPKCSQQIRDHSDKSNANSKQELACSGLRVLLTFDNSVHLYDCKD